ncbi:MAG: PAS domain S-box protein [Verrucomicrobia bacterium]|nr:PAS domain S-box protein [Verrucomicrobiota bacterium]
MKILAIDDNPDNLTVLKAVLRDSLPDAGLVTALNGPKGLDLAAAEDPDMILLDIVMPGMDGYDVCRNLKADAFLKTIPVLFLTAHTDRDSRIKAVEAGADGFLSKPFDELELTVQVQAMTKIKAADRRERLEKEELAALVAERTRELEQEMDRRMEQEMELKKSESQLRAITDSAQDAILMMDSKGKITFWNPAASRIFGYTRDEALGRDLHSLIAHPRHHAAHAAAFPTFSKTGQGYAMGKALDLEGIHKDGREISVRLSLSAIEIDGAWHATGILQDITERRKEHKLLQKATLLLQKTSRIAKIGGWELDLVTNNIAWTSETYRLHEIGEDYHPKLSDGLSFYPPESRPAIEEAIKRAIEKGARFDVEVPFVTAKGRHLWVRSSGEPEFEGGKCVRLSGTFQDITERMQAEEELQTLRMAVEQSANMIEITDPNGNIEYVNPAFEKGTGYSSTETIGRNPRILKSGRQDKAFYANLWETILSGNIWRGEFHNRRKDGSLYWESATISPVQNDEGKIAHFLAIKEDITERKALEASLTDALARAETGNRTKTEFLAVMSHELRTPLNGVLGFAELLTETTSLSEEQQTYAETISRSGNHLLAIVNDILDFSSIEKGAMAIHIEPLAVADLVKASALAVRKSAMDKGLSFECKFGPDVPEKILGDDLRIRQILINLLGNAVKFTSSGSVTIRVTRSGRGAWASRPREAQGSATMPHPRVEECALTASQEPSLNFSIEDTGIGMSSETIGILFQPFTQADMTMHRTFGGTGLGLAISKRLAEAMDGTLAVESAPGKGSTFTFRLPLIFSDGGMAAAPARLSDRGENPSALTEQRPPAQMGGTPANGTLVLVVEDDPDNSQLAGKMLNSLGCRVEFASNGQEALEAFRPGKFCAILMDMQMPLMNGLAATEKIRSLEAEAGGHVPIVALTANVMPGDEERCLAAGMDAFLTKPFTKACLAAKLAGVGISAVPDPAGKK